MKRKQPGLLRVIDISLLNRKIQRLLFGLGYESVSYIHRHQDLLVFGNMSDRLSL